jgi:hypothetical protein
MPKFFYSVIFAVLLSWGFIAYLVLVVPAGSYTAILLFITVLFVALSLSLSIPIYFYLKKKNPDFLNKNLLYRRSFKYSAFIAFGISGIAFLRAFKIISLLNMGLFMLLYVGIFYQLKSKR